MGLSIVIRDITVNTKISKMKNLVPQECVDKTLPLSRCFWRWWVALSIVDQSSTQENNKEETEKLFLISEHM